MDRPLEARHAVWPRIAHSRAIFRWSLSFSCHLFRFPHYTRQFLAELRRLRPRPSASDLAQYEAYSRNHVFQKLLYVCLHLAFALKLAWPVYWTLSSADLSRPERNLRASLWDEERLGGETSAASPRVGFMCLETNCSRLAPDSQHGQLAEDLARLPLFATCAGHQKTFWNPLVAAQAFGLTTLAALAFFILLMGLVAPIYAYCKPITSHLVLDVLCPQVSHTLARKCLAGHLADLLYSQLNHGAARHTQLGVGGRRPFTARFFAPAHLGASRGSTQAGSPLLPNALDLLEHFDRPAAPKQVRRTVARLKRLKKLDGVAEEGLLRDCLPLQLTEWFRVNWTQAMVLSFTLNMVGGLIGGIGFWLWLASDQSHLHLYRAYECQMELTNCHLWRVDMTMLAPRGHGDNDGSGSGSGKGRPRAQLVDLNTIVDAWQFWQVFEFLGAPALPFYMATMSILQYYHSMNFLCLLLLDLGNQLKIIVELTELLRASATAAGGAGGKWARVSEPLKLKGAEAGLLAASAHDDESPMSCIRGRLYDLVHPDFMILRSYKLRRLDGRAVCSELEHRLANQEFARLLAARDTFDLDAYVDLLEKLHINYWLFMDALKEHHAPVTICLTFSYTLNYGFALLGLYLFRSFKEFVALPIVLTVFALFIGNVLVSLSSNVHAKAKRLEAMFWTLIAATAHCSDERVLHLRHLWVKQLSLIDSDGGLALKMFKRINVTYVGIIQSLIWTASLLLLAYSRPAGN